jgi:hypothetical protein
MAALLDFEHVGTTLTCGRCSQGDRSLFRCSTCLGKGNYCQYCMVDIHRAMPLHRIVFWDMSVGCFRDTTLGSLGLTLTLGHGSYSFECPQPSPPCNLTVVHTNGLHDLSVRFCNCTQSSTPDIQLFQYRLFSSTVKVPQTAFSFEVLEQFRLHHLEGKGSAHTFMNALYRLTEDMGCLKVEVCFSFFSLAQS